jgi:hypothetical protein
MSKARKQREHLVRNGKPDPAASRLSWNGVNPVTKKTPSKRSLIDRAERKYKGAI